MMNICCHGHLPLNNSHDLGNEGLQMKDVFLSHVSTEDETKLRKHHSLCPSGFDVRKRRTI